MALDATPRAERPFVQKPTAAVVVCTLTACVWGLSQEKRPATNPNPADAIRTADAEQRTRSKNNLRQILTAIRDYHDTYGRFPQNVTGDKKNLLLSWRVEILPFLKQDELYKEFRRDEAWDSEHNKKLLAKMPAVYRVGFEPKDSTTTYYQGFAGPGTVFESGVRVKLVNITDGTASTLAVVEAGPPVEWTKPADLPYDRNKPLPKLAGPFANILTAATADGAVRFLRRDLDEKTLRLLIERDDDESVSIDDALAKFPLVGEELKSAQELLREHEQLFTALAEERREQQKLLAELAKQRKQVGPIEGFDLENLRGMRSALKRVQEESKKETEELRKEAGKK